MSVIWEKKIAKPRILFRFYMVLKKFILTILYYIYDNPYIIFCKASNHGWSDYPFHASE